jgi:hypothetical protein
MLDAQVLPLKPSQVAETLSERLELEVRAIWRSIPDDSDARCVAPLLLCPGGEGRGDEAANQSGDEGSPVHYSIT